MKNERMNLNDKTTYKALSTQEFSYLVENRLKQALRYLKYKDFQKLLEEIYTLELILESRLY